jgi:3'(2'), 5'-bisphosphate nucleotidase
VALLSDDLVARDLAAAAGDLLMGLRESAGAASAEAVLPAPAATALRRDGDLRSHQFLASRLGQLRPADAVLSEEAADSPARLSADRVWIIDPLDGTREFGEPGRTDWAVHVALWSAGGLTAGAVALPAQGRVLSTASPRGVRGVVPQGGHDGADSAASRGIGSRPLRLLVSRSRPPAFVQAMADDVGADLVGMGSAGAKAAAVIMGEADAYVHSGGQYEWDSAAPVAVALAAGLHASRIDGSALRYNQADPSVPDILICPLELADRLLSAIGRARSADGQGHRGPEPVPLQDHLPTEPEHR